MGEFYLSFFFLHFTINRSVAAVLVSNESETVVGLFIKLNSN